MQYALDLKKGTGLSSFEEACTSTAYKRLEISLLEKGFKVLTVQIHIKHMNITSKRWSWMRQSAKAFTQEFWLAFALLTISTITIAAVFWIFAHPYGTTWDEARYINRAYRDVAFFEKGGIVELIKVLVNEDKSRPPAYRLLALPITLLFGANSTIIRLISLVALWVSLAFIYLASRRIAGSNAGAFAVAFLAVCPIIIGSNMRFYVDYPFYLAIAALLYFLFLDWNSAQQPNRSWIGFGLALGLGVLAKPPFIFIAGPIMLLTLILSWRKVIVSPRPMSLAKASVLASAVMLPWWVFNFKPALAKAFLSGNFVRHSLGPKSSPETIVKWLNVFAQSVLGSALTLLTLAILATLLIKLIRKQLRIDATTVSAIAVCLAGTFPMLILAAFGTNHNPRLITPTLLPLAVAIGVIAALTHWTTSRWLAAITTAVFCFQLALMVSPSPGEPRYQSGDAASQQLLWGNPTMVMQRIDQWDWSQLWEICNARQIKSPLIAYLGNSRNFNPPQIGYPWVRANENIKVTWLWQYTFGQIDWDKVMGAVNASDVVLTAPNLVGRSVDNQDLDNQHNTELVQRLQKDSQFSEPLELKMGRFEPVQVLVFLRKPEYSPPSVPLTTKLLDIF